MNTRSTIDLLPPKGLVEQTLGRDDFFVWEYYGKGLFGRMHSWIFRRRYRIILNELEKRNENPQLVLDVGCGPSFTAYFITQNFNSYYVGVDVLPASRLRRFRHLIELTTGKPIDIIRASAESLPFKQETFDLVLSLDVLEHLKNPRKAIAEISTISKDLSLFIVSLPLENILQRLSRIGFIVMGVRTTIKRKLEYHYIGNVNSYDEMIVVIAKSWNLIIQRFSPFGLTRSLNINGITFNCKKLYKGK